MLEQSATADHAAGDPASRRIGHPGNDGTATAYFAEGTQTVEDTVANWRNVAACPN